MLTGSRINIRVDCQRVKIETEPAYKLHVKITIILKIVFIKALKNQNDF